MPVLLFVVLALIVAFALWLVPQVVFDHALGSALRAVRAGRPAEAEPRFLRARRLAERLGIDDARLASCDDGLGCAYLNLERNTEAEASLRSALALCEKVWGERTELAAVLDHLVLAIERQGRDADAEPFGARAVLLRTRLHGRDDPDTCASLARHAAILVEVGRYREARALAWEALEGAEARLPAGDIEMAPILSTIGTILTRRSRGLDAEWGEQIYRRLLALAQGLPDRPDIEALALRGLGLNLGIGGRYTEAESVLRKALVLCEAKLGSEDAGTADALAGVAMASGWLGRFKEAEELHRRALAIRESARGSDARAVASSHLLLSGTLLALADYAEGEQLARLGIASYEASYGAEHPRLAVALLFLIAVLIETARYDEAEATFARAVRLRELAAEPNASLVGTFQNQLGVLRCRRGNYAEAEALHRQAMSSFEALLPGSVVEVANARHLLALALIGAGEAVAAEALARDVVATREVWFGAEHPDLAGALHTLGRCLQLQARGGEAEALHRRSAAIAEATLGPSHPLLAWPLADLADLLGTTGDPARDGEAESLATRALALREAALPGDHPDLAESRTVLADLYRTRGRSDAAEPLYRRALDDLARKVERGHTARRRALEGLVALLLASGRAEEAADLSTDPV